VVSVEVSEAVFQDAGQDIVTSIQEVQDQESRTEGPSEGLNRTVSHQDLSRIVSHRIVSHRDLNHIGNHHIGNHQDLSRIGGRSLIAEDGRERSRGELMMV